MRRILILTLLAGLAAAGKPTTKETKQLTVTISADRESATSGQHATLVLDIDLKPKMHVYAPGVQHYIAIDWQMASTELAKSQPAAWPKAERLHLDAIDETVPAYTGHFRVVRDIVFAPATKLKGNPNPLTITGTLKYQACDDRMCYIPASVPLEWTFNVEQK